MDQSTDLGSEMYGWATDLFPICRSLTGDGVRESLAYLVDKVPAIQVKSVPSGTDAFDWKVPDEWTIRDATVTDKEGKCIVDFKKSNLHVLGYSEPVKKWVKLDELQKHLYSLPDQPDAIPYITSYYSRRWGFCIAHNDREKLADTDYYVHIDSELKPGQLNYGELIIKGETKEEVFLSTYICHPSMANNEISGPVVTLALARWLSRLGRRRYTYRIVFIPETIGSIVYLSKNLSDMKENIIAGYNITCVGDERCFSYLPSRNGDTISDHAALNVLTHLHPQFRRYTWFDRGSDERQYCSPGVDLPIASVMRSKFGEYPEYHTSLDNLSVISPAGLHGSFHALKKCIEIIENNCTPVTKVFCEPQLGRRGLYPTLSTKDTAKIVRSMMDLISCSDGSKTLLQIAGMIGQPFESLLELANKLAQAGVLKINA